MDVQEVDSFVCSRETCEQEPVRTSMRKRALDAKWHEEIENGQVYISVSSEEEEEENACVEQISRVCNETKKLEEPEVFTINDSSSEDEKVEILYDAKEDEKKKEEEPKKEEGIGDDVIHITTVNIMDKKKKPQWKAVGKQHVERDQDHVPEVRKRRLGEENAAFLLFYGKRKTTSARGLRRIIELILTDVGMTNKFYASFVEYLLWCKFSSVVEACLACESYVQSEWTKIVFSCSVPPHRRRSGPMRQPDLLPRPITITVRPLFFARKQLQRHKICASNSSVEVATKQEVLISRSKSDKAAVSLVDKPAGKSIQSKVKSPKKSMKTAQTKSPRGEVRKRPLGSPCSNGMTPSQKPIAFLPRKRRRQSGKVGLTSLTQPQVARAKSPSCKNISEALTEPLPFNIWTRGDNRSLPIGLRAPGPCGEHDRSENSLMANSIKVNPMFQMTADEIAQHVASLRREGRFTIFEKATDLLLKLMSDPRNRHGVFNTPVDPVALKLHTYTSIVQHPMDLGTIKRNLSAGEYLELADFVSDVRLVFENAMLFNPKTHYIHVDAEVLLNRFNESVKAEQNKQAKRQRVRHVCLVCRGNTCIVCHQQCMDVAQPNLQCSAGCSTDIRKGSAYFISQDGTRVWCRKCKTRMAKDCSSTYRAHNDNVNALLYSLIKKKAVVGVEPWVKCGECGRWLHQVCGLYNPVIGAYESQKFSKMAPEALSVQTNPYVCPLCRCRRKRATSPPQSIMRKILNVDPDEHAQNSSCLNIPNCELSIFIQSFLHRGLNEAGEFEAARTLFIRALSFPGERMAVPEGVVRAFNANSQMLSQLRPGTDTSSQQIPAHISYLSRGLYLFQKHEGMEVCLFTIYAQEFGDNCELQTNRRAVYIAYLDSVRYLKPASARTTAYHLILLAYFDYLRRHGFSRVHIWSCPPQKRISYVFWCRPAYQKTPNSEHLRCWYNKLLVKAKECGIVQDWTTLYDRYFTDSVCDVTAGGNTELPVSFMSMNGKEEIGVATRAKAVQSMNSDALVWPAKQLPPLFDGDIVPIEFERILGRIVSRNKKQKQFDENTKSVACNESSSCARVKDNVSSGGSCTLRKEEGSTVLPFQVNATVRELFSKCQLAIQRLKQDLLVVNLKLMDDDGILDDNGTCIAKEGRSPKGCYPETLVPSWHEQVPRFFGNRFMFHQLCSYAGYQFDSLRRAKHSTMMILHHFFNEQMVQVNVFCRECSLLITRADFWSCSTCKRYALCDTCYWRQGDRHPHDLIFGPAARWIPQISDRPLSPVKPLLSMLPEQEVRSVKSKGLVNAFELC